MATFCVTTRKQVRLPVPIEKGHKWLAQRRALRVLYIYQFPFLVSSPGPSVFLQVLRVLGIKYQYSRAKMPPKGKRKAKTTLDDKPGKKKKQGKVC